MGENIKIGYESFIPEDLFRRFKCDEWCWLRINQLKPLYKYILTLCLSPTFPICLKIESLNIWSKDSDCTTTQLAKLVFHIYRSAYMERGGDFLWVNELFQDTVPTSVRVLAAKKATLDLKPSVGDLEEITLAL